MKCHIVLRHSDGDTPLCEYLMTGAFMELSKNYKCQYTSWEEGQAAIADLQHRFGPPLKLIEGRCPMAKGGLEEVRSKLDEMGFRIEKTDWKNPHNRFLVTFPNGNTRLFKDLNDVRQELL